MRFAVLFLLAVMIYGLFSTHFSVRRSRGAEERAAAMRFAAFYWMAGILVVALLFLPLPGRQRLLFLVPVLLIGMSVKKILGGARERIRQKERDEVDIERMKRIN